MGTTETIDWDTVFAHGHEQTLGESEGGLGRGRVVKSLEKLENVSPQDAQRLIRTALSSGDLDQEGSMLTRDSVQETEPIVVGDQLIPYELAKRNWWVLWVNGNKTPVAPWETGHMYPAQWGSSAETRPETTFEQARQWGTHSGINTLPAPEKIDTVNLGLILPFEPHDGALTVVVVDMDKVRRKDGTLHPRAKEFLERFNSFAEISTSGTGVHIFIVAKISDDIPTVDLPLGEEPFVVDEEFNPDGTLPHMEIFHRKRMFAFTGNHIKGTPEVVYRRQELLDEILNDYHQEQQTADQILEQRVHPHKPISNPSSNCSPYYDADVASVAVTAGASLKQQADEYRSDHPQHGGTHGNNFAIASDGSVWRCYRGNHNMAGGNALQLVAVCEEFIDCPDCAQSRPLDRLSEQDFARLCLVARDKYGFRGKPPYRALVGVALNADLALNKRDDGSLILGSLYEIALSLYEGMAESDIKS